MTAASGRWWLLVSLALGVPAALAGWVPLNAPTSTWPGWAANLALHPDAGWLQPAWTWWTSAWLHGSPRHLMLNLAALSLICLWGLSARLPSRCALAWLLAWPATQIGMLHQPLHTYIGLSGVLHAGTAIIALQHLLEPDILDKRARLFGGLLLSGLILKIFMENPWGPVLIPSTRSDINVAPWAHLSGAIAGTAFYLLTSVTKLAPSVKRLTRKQRTLN